MTAWLDQYRENVPPSRGPTTLLHEEIQFGLSHVCLWLDTRILCSRHGRVSPLDTSRLLAASSKYPGFRQLGTTCDRYVGNVVIATYVWDSGYIYVTEQQRVVEFGTLDAVEAAELLAIWDTCNANEQNKVNLGLLTCSKEGIEIQSCSGDAQPFIRGNYSDDTCEAFDEIVLNIQDPKATTGRLVIAAGDAGSGKTHLIHGLMDARREAQFITVEPSRLKQLTDPDHIKALLTCKKKPIVLVVEDADECLVRRGPGNMSDISAILNLSDGLIGSLLNLRIICTTNAQHDDFDLAVVRNMRLLRYIAIGALSAEKASTRYREMTGETKQFTAPILLADLYAEAAKHRTGLTLRKNPIGF